MTLRGSYYRWSAKKTVDRYIALDIAQIARTFDMTQTIVGKLFQNDEPKLGYIIYPGVGMDLIYSYRDQPVTPYRVSFTYTTPGAGGKRVWFLCPRCRRRCRILYGGHPFACRQCHNLTYKTRQQSRLDARQTAIRNRMRKLEARLGTNDTQMAYKSPDKPPTMQHRTYYRLLAELMDLRMLDTWVWTLGVSKIYGSLANLGVKSGPEPESLAMVEQDWKRIRREARQKPGSLQLRYGRLMSNLHDREAWAQSVRPAWAEYEENRLTLGKLAAAAGVPYAFAQEAIDEGLLRADGGRETRKKRYRKRLASWLAKLYRLRNEGMGWAEIRAWTKRRFLPGCEHERQWPANGSR